MKLYDYLTVTMTRDIDYKDTQTVVKELRDISEKLGVVVLVVSHPTNFKVTKNKFTNQHRKPTGEATDF